MNIDDTVFLAKSPEGKGSTNGPDGIVSSKNPEETLRVATGLEETVSVAEGPEETVILDEAQITGPENSERSDINADDEKFLSNAAQEALASSEPLAALEHQDQQRTRRVAPLMAIVGTATLLTVFVFEGVAWAKALFYLTNAASVIAMLWLWWLATRGPVQGWQSTAARSTAFSTTCASCIYFGIFSPAPMIMALAVVIFAQGKNVRLARGTYIAAALTQGGMTVLDALQVLADPGMIQAIGMGTPEKLAAQLLVQLLLVAAYLLGRFTRGASAEALAKTHQAMRELARREVISLEAREGVKRAFNIGGAGRLSGSVLGPYRLRQIIGYGGMGEIYQAVHATEGTPAAVKIIHQHLCSDEKLLQRFLREAQLSASVKSPYIARVIDAGMVAQGPFIAMELLEGQDLATHLQIAGRLSLAELQALARQVGAGLDAAAEVKIVHRDIKPQNIFVVDQNWGSDDSGTWGTGELFCKILDFGVARVISGQADLTQGDTVLGTPNYMSPEQATGKVTDHRADLHSLAAVLYRGCTGFLPFTGENPQAVLYAVVHAMPTPPSQMARLPVTLDAFFEKAFAKSPDDRYQSGHEMSEALRMACDTAAV